MLRGILTVGGWTMASRLLGFARDVLIALHLTLRLACIDGGRRWWRIGHGGNSLRKMAHV